ncbi:obscurin-like protein 1 isoform X4 [Platichthys flesus]|uniref:obscurin-like protein 1 isoform X4 n=1 Tax=Platichthys flesus TaxID=8260 RepID=UPI002DBFA2DA|nr:obscurin-like protein 1 isoform X4 [Platichthys flesus]
MDVFGGAPRFLAYPRPVVVQTGTDAVLKCQIGGDPRPAVIWERNNEKIDPQGQYRVFEDGNVYNLIISAVTTDDSGQYICKAKNSIGETYAAATLNVEGEAQEMELREENKPRFLIKPLSTRAGRGEDAVFSCKLWGKPRPEVVWEKDGRKLNEIFESTHFTVGYQDGGWFQLKIFKTRAPDGGVYTCKARNEFGESLAGAVLLVDAGPGHEEEGNRNGYTNGHWKGHQGKQRIGRQVPNRLKDDTVTKSTKVKMFAVTEGKHAKFRCFVTGKPKPEIIWRKDGRLILSGRRYLLYEDREGYFTLKVLYCKQKDNGVYVCAASNTAGQTLSAVHLSVKEPPVRFKQPLIDLEVWERDLAVLECEVPEDSVAITWYLEDRRLQPGAKYGMEEWGTKRRLTIRDIGVDDDGIYLCEMPDGGRSIAEVAVKGTIVRKLPRKVDVLEGENAAFCVEVEKEEMDIHWYKDGTELRETHQTILKSFGRTHILVFVNTMPQDAGLVTFLVGRSKTSSQLRVKAARHCPPSCPVGVQINTERANAALLSWAPAQDSRKNPPSGYVLERQEVGTGSQEWLQCLTTDSATSVEILGDSVPCEADYRFRICSVNKYGKSNNVEFPKAVHLVPVTRIQAPLQDALVPEGQDAVFSIELSASVIGTWFLNGTQLQEDERFFMRRSRTHESLRIRGVRDTDNGAEITFIAYGIRDSAALYIQAPLVKFSSMSEMDRNKFVEIGNPIVLYCELSDPAAAVHWFKNGVELQTMEGLHIQSEGTMRRIVIQSAEFSHSGVYCCDAIDDIIRFNVEVEAPPVRFTAIPDAERNKSIQAGCPIVLQCELSDPSAQVYWYKDGSKLLPQNGVDTQSEGLGRTLIMHSAEFFHSGLYCCKTKGDAITFSVDITAPPVKFSAIPDDMRTQSIEAGCPIVLQCMVSDPEAHVCWCKDEIQLISNSAIEIQSEGNTRTIVVQSAELCHSGVYRCKTLDDIVEFHVDVKAPTLPLSPSPDLVETQSLEAACPTEPACEPSGPAAQVSWQRDTQRDSNTQPDFETEAVQKTLVIEPTHPSKSGTYYCATADVAQLIVENQEPSPKPQLGSDVEKTTSAEECCPIVQQFEISDPIAKACWYKDGTQIYPKRAAGCESQSSSPALPLQSRDLSGDERVGCDTTADDDAQLNVDMTAEQCHYGEEIGEIAEASAQYSVDVQALPVTITRLCEAERNKSVEAGEPIVLQCEVSDPNAQVAWCKDGMNLRDAAGQDMVAEGSIRTLAVRSAMPSHAGIYICKTTDDAVQFHVDVKAPLPEVSALSEADQPEPVVADSPVALQSELSEPTRRVSSSPDGTELLPQSGVDFQSEGNLTSLVVPSAEQAHSDVYRSSPVKFSELQESDGNKSVREGASIILHCDLARDPSAHVDWYKDGMQLLPQNNVEIESEGLTRTLLIRSAEITHSGTYECSTADDSVTFKVDVKGRSPQIMPIAPSEKCKRIAVGFPIILQCEVSEPVAQVSWFKDRVELFCKTGLDMKRDGSLRKLMIHSAKVSDSGLYSCSLADDVVTFQVDIEAAPVRLAALPVLPEIAGDKLIEASCPIKMQCEASEPTAQVYWHKDGEQLLPESKYEIETKGNQRALVIQSAEVRHSGLYSCEASDDHRELKVDVAAVPEAERNKSVEATSLTKPPCQMSDPANRTHSNQDGVKILPKSGVNVDSDGRKRTLVTKSAPSTNSRVYDCRTDDDSDLDDFYVEVKAPPVTFADIPEEELFKSVVEREPLVLSCDVSRTDGIVQWYKDGAEMKPSDNVSLQTDGTRRDLTIHSAQLSDTGTYTCRAGDHVLIFKVTIREPPVMIVYPKEDVHLDRHVPDEIILSCELSRANGVVSWYKDGQKLQDSENIKLKVEGPYRRLKIISSGVDDSGEYVCDTADDSIFFHLCITEPPVRIVSPSQSQMELCQQTSERMVLSCEISRPNAAVRWYRDGLEVEENHNLILEVDGVYRRLIIPETTVKDSAEYVCDTADDSMTFFVNIAEPPVRFIRARKMSSRVEKPAGETLVLDCEVSRSNAEVIWKKNGEEIEDSRNITILDDGVVRQLTIHSLTEKDAGQYVCDAKDDVMDFNVKVQEPPVQIIGNSGHPEHHILVAGDDLILECEVSRPNAAVQWLWNGEILKPDPRIKIDSRDVVRKLVLSGLQPSDSGKYICDAVDDKLITLVEVQEPPAMFLNKEASNNISACESQSVTLSAVVSRERANVRWLKDGQLLNQDNIHISSEGNTHKLTINPLQLSDSGSYVCDINTDQMFFTLLVKEMKVKFIRPVENTVCARGSSLTLRCEINKPKGDVQWLKDGQEIPPSRRHTIRAQGRERSFTIHQVVDEDSGEYTCESTDDRTSSTVSVETPRVVEFIAELRNITIREGEDAVFKCVVSPEDTQLVWRLNGKQVALNERTVVSSNGLCHMLCIHNCLVSDGGRVTADAEGLVSEAELQVQEEQVLFTQKMMPVVAEEYGEALLEVEVSVDSEEVQWMRQGVLIHPDAKYTLKHKGQKHSLSIRPLAMSDRGTYSCETLHDRTQAQLTVEPRKISIRKGLSDITTTERETASFEVELSHPDVPGTWMRNGIKLKPTNHFRTSAKGHVHSLSISHLSVEDTGSFVFSVDNLRTTARLVVKEPPVTIFRKLEDQKFPDGSVVAIECELSRHNVDVKWFKNEVELKPSKGLRIYAMGRKRFLQILKCRVCDSGIFTCDAGDATTSCTVEVYERELLIVQALEDVDIQEDQNAVFVCEISVEDVPGEWYKNGERIQPTSTIKIRQEGTKHFLLMCSVRAEDCGEIKFVARHVESVAHLEVEEIPINIVKPLQDKTVLEKTRGILDCAVSNSRCSIRWYKGCNVILPSERFEISSEGCYRKLIIQQVALHDEGMYSVQVGEHSCSAKLTVESQSVLLVRELRDVEVMAPDDATFECEVSPLAVEAPEWSLKGEPLQPGPRVHVEKTGSVHRLTLSQTSSDMSGEVEFSSGSARSSAQLRVLGDA